MQKGTRVKLLGFGYDDKAVGTVENIRHDDRGEALITVAMDNKTFSPDGFMLARIYELEEIS